MGHRNKEIIMTLSPNLVADIKKTGKFTDDQLKIIAERWYDFSQDLSFNRCTTAEMIKEARMVLACAKAYPKKG